MASQEIMTPLQIRQNPSGLFRDKNEAVFVSTPFRKLPVNTAQVNSVNLVNFLNKIRKFLTKFLSYF